MPCRSLYGIFPVSGMKRNIRDLKGVGEKTEKLFNKAGITTVEELLHDYPRTYDIYEKPVPVSDVKEGMVCTIRAQIATSLYVNRTSRRQVIGVTAADPTGRIQLIWFNAPYLRGTLKKGMLFVFRGKVTRHDKRLQMEHPQVFTPAAYQEVEESLQPVYHLTAGLSNKTVVRMVRQAMEETDLSADFLPDKVRQKNDLCDINYALQTIHFPKNREELFIARRRLVFDEFFLFVLAVQKLKAGTIEKRNEFPMKASWVTEDVIENLPYKLTNAQTNVWHEIEQDLCGRFTMSRLVQGDVGSGKTILAFLAMILAAENGRQSALMVPTEVLARQHYESMQDLLAKNSLTKHGVVLLTGSMTAKEKREAYARIADGSAAMIIGTHALIQEKVAYHDLGLVITDEQHRFGVRQREELSSRGRLPHVLVMSATPIPRTLAIILYGDLDISIVDELPASRLPIKNAVVDTSYRPKAYRFIEKQVREGRQAYVICPMVEESDELDAENVTDYTHQLREELPGDIRVEMLHGKMKPKEKNRIMDEFASGEIQVLVSTTVVEVGVNVPNATVMMVENAERFGLAQLHQLRGRVGRGEHQSYCIFIQGNDDEETRKRLDILNHSNDGFYIAGEDLKLRGPGDLFGIRQSGDMQFRIGDIFQDSKFLKEASEAAAEVLQLDPDLTLPQNRNLAETLQLFVKEQLENLGI